MKTFDSVLINIENHIATVTLNRPGAGNSFDGEFFKEVAEAIYLCEGDENVQVILLTGSGRNFSVGGDIQQMANPGFLSYDVSILSGEMSASVRKCKKPVVAVINGVAAGAGCALTMRKGSAAQAWTTLLVRQALTADVEWAPHSWLFDFAAALTPLPPP